MSEPESPSRRPRTQRVERQAAKRKRTILWSGILLVLIAGALLAKPVYRGLKTQRADHLATEAEELVRAGKLNEAASKYRAALQLDPLGYQPLSGAARLATRGARPEATDLWQQVIHLPQSTTADRQEYVALLLQRGALKSAEKILDELLKAPDAKTLSLAAQLASKQADDPKALEYARLAVDRAPEEDAMRFQLAELLAKSGEEAQRAEARQVLWLLAEKSGPTKKAAVEALARAPELSSEEQEKILSALNALPEGGVVTGLLASELKLKLEPDSAERIYQEAVAQWAQADAGDLAELARWLNLHKQFERVLTLLPTERAVTAEPLLLSRLDALANVQQWKEIDQLLERPDLGLDPAVVESFRARNSMGLGSALDAELHWDRAIALASGNAFKLRFVASFAEQSRATAAALKGYDQLARFPEQAAFAQRGRQRLLDQSGDATAARTTAERLATVAPDDVNAQAELIHLNLLLGLEVEANVEKAKALVEKYPTRLSFRITAALGALRQHNADAALAQFNGPPIEWERTPPGWRAIYAATLLANDREEEARKLAATIPRERLNKEERELIVSLGNQP